MGKFKRDDSKPVPANAPMQLNKETGLPPIGSQTAAHPAKPAADGKRRKRRRTWWAIGIILGVLAIAAVVFVFTVGKGKFKLSNLVAAQVERTVGHTPQLAGQSSGRTNILVYGMTADGLRTDSIILLSYYWQQKKLVTLNIPRDLYVYDGYEYDKMGEVYAYAKGRQPHNASYPDSYVASVISKEYGIPVNYWVQFNMQGETDFVNAIGGVDVNAPDSFTDCEYPTWDYSGYIRPCPSFRAGEQHMNGGTALIFSRSRHSLDNNEGT